MKKEKNFSCPCCCIRRTAAEKEKSSAGASRHKSASQTAHERIEALRKAGVDVSHLFAMQGANGGEYIASNKNGKLAILDDSDPIFACIAKQGTVPNRRLFRRWIMAQMFHLMSYDPHNTGSPAKLTEMIHRLGYDYQWKMLVREMYAQMKMEGRDKENFTDRNRWFNKSVLIQMVTEYMQLLERHIDSLRERKCKGIPYKHIGNRDIFISDLFTKIYCPLNAAIARVEQAQDASQLYYALVKFNDLRIRLPFNAPQHRAWIDAYKGAGAFFTMQNLIRFHNCVATDKTGETLDKEHSLTFLTMKAESYKNGEGWRLFALLKKMLKDNNIDIKQKIAEWRECR